MRPDDRLPNRDEASISGADLASDPYLERLVAELAAAGDQARRALNGRTQPTRVYSVNLRAWLLGRLGPAGSANEERRSS
jgi:hypothetical protein